MQRPLRPARRLLSTRIEWFVGSAAMDPGFSPSGEGWRICAGPRRL